MLDAVHTIIAVGWVYVYEELLTFWKYYCVGESESEKDSSGEEKKKKKHKKSRKSCHKKRKGKDLEDSCCELHSTALIIPLEDQMLRFNGMAGVS